METARRRLELCSSSTRHQ